MKQITPLLEKTLIVLFSTFSLLFSQASLFAQQVSTFAGFGIGGTDGLPGPSSEFAGPHGIVADNNGNIYVADEHNHSIRKITTDGIVSTIAGNGTQGFADGIGSNALFYYPSGIAIDNSGNLFIADSGNNRIRKITPDGTVTTIAGDGLAGSDDGPVSSASFNNPTGLTIDEFGNLFVTDIYNHKIRKISFDGVVTTLAGGTPGSADGQGASASFNNPIGITLASDGNLYITDSGNHKIRVIASDGTVTSLAGSNTFGSNDGIGSAASFYYPYGIVSDNSGYLYVADRGNSKIRKVSLAGEVSTFIGNDAGFNDGITSLASFTIPQGLAVDVNGNLLVTDTGNNKIRKISSTNVVSTIAGSGNSGFLDGVGTSASFYMPVGLFRDSDGSFYFTNGNTIRKIDPNGTVSTVAGNGQPGSAYGVGTNSSFTAPIALTLDPSGNIYVIDNEFHHIRKIAPDGTVTTFAGSGSPGSADGMGINASFNHAYDLISDQQGNLYVADFLNYKIRKITPDGNVTTFAGNGLNGNIDGPVESATFQGPLALCADQSGNIFVLDGVNTVRKISPDLIVSTIPINFIPGGLFPSSGFMQPNRIAIDANGMIYVTDQYRVHRIRPNGKCSILAGDQYNNNNGNPCLDGIRYYASFNYPFGIVCDPSGLVYVADEFNNKIRTITPCQTAESFSVTCNSPSISGNCNGLAAVHSNGLATTMISIDGGPFAYTGNTNPSLFDQCPGVHDLRILTECEDTLSIQYVVPLETNFIINNTYPDSVAIDTLGSTQINCEIDYTSILDAYIDTAFYSSDTVTVFWHIVDNNGIHLDTATYIIDDPNGVYWFQLSLFCPNRSDGEWFAVMENLYLEGNSTLGFAQGIINQPVVSVYPNPSNNEFTIRADSNFNTITIFDSSGKIIQAMTMFEITTIDASHWSKGIYFLEVVSENGKAIKRLVKQ